MLSPTENRNYSKVRANKLVVWIPESKQVLSVPETRSLSL